MSGVLVVGLDGLNWAMLDKMAENNATPTLSSLRSNSPTGICKSTVPCLTCPALPALYTGMNPGNFGIFDFVKPDGSITNLTDIDVPKAWDYLDEADKRSLIAGMRTTHPAPQTNGIFISGVLSAEDEPHYVTPEKYREEARRFNESYPNVSSLIDDDNRETIGELLQNYTERQVDVFIELFEESADEFDLGWLWMASSDSAQHHLWGHDDLLIEFFREFDRNVDRLVGLTERNELDLVFVSDHGFGPTAEFVFHLNEWLYSEGYLSVVGGRLGKPFVNLSYVLAERYLDDKLKRRILSILKRVSGRDGSADAINTGVSENEMEVVSPLDQLPGINWGATRAHMSTRKGWGINIREPLSTEDYESLRSEIINQLSELGTPTGRPLVKNAWRGEEVYSGKFADQIPDIIVLFDDTVRARPSLTGKLFTEKSGGRALGSHMAARDGIIMGTGPRIRGEDLDLGEINIYDILPTILYIMGLPIPNRLDGRVIRDVFEPGSPEAEDQIEYKTYHVEPSLERGEFGQGEGVRQSLRDLGYIS